MSAVAESSLVPKGRPSKALFIVGAVGCITNAIAAIWFCVPACMSLLDRYVPLFSDEPFWIIGYVLLVIGLILASVGYLGARRHYGSAAGIAGFAVAVVVSVLFLLPTVWRITGYLGYLNFEEYWRLYSYVLCIVYEIFFVMLILWGVTHITTRRSTGKSGLSLATGIILILAAVFVQVWDALFVVDITLWWYDYQYAFWDIMNVSTGIWTLLFFVSQILATTLFVMAEVPELPA